MRMSNLNVPDIMGEKDCGRKLPHPKKDDIRAPLFLNPIKFSPVKY